MSILVHPDKNQDDLIRAQKAFDGEFFYHINRIEKEMYPQIKKFSFKEIRGIKFGKIKMEANFPYTCKVEYFGHLIFYIIPLRFSPFCDM